MNQFVGMASSKLNSDTNTKTQVTKQAGSNTQAKRLQN